MNDIFKVFISLSVSGLLLALLLFAIKPLVNNRLSKNWQYYIWLIVILRFLVPYTPEVSIVGGLFNIAENTADEYLEQAQAEAVSLPSDVSADVPNVSYDVSSENTTQLTAQPTAQPKSTNYWRDIKDNIWLFWIGVTFLLFVRKLTSYNSFVRYVRAGMHRIEEKRLLEINQEVAREFGLKKSLPIYINTLISSPMLVGIFRPIIIISSLEINDEEFRYTIRHELTHYKRLDIVYKWLIQVAVCLHWFNPLIYIISREINKACELSCDEAIINKLDEDGRLQYGDTLLSTLKSDGTYGDTIVSLTLSENTKLLKERLGAIMKYKKKTKYIAIISLALAIFILCGAAYAGAYSIANDRISQDEISSSLSDNASEPVSASQDIEATDMDANAADNTPMAESSDDNGNIQAQNISSVSLWVDNSSVTVRKSENDQFQYYYDQSIFEINQADEGSNIDITVKRIINTSVKDKVAIIYLPSWQYEDIYVESMNSAVVLPELNANLHLSCDNSSMVFPIPADFDKSVVFDSTNSATVININEDLKDYTIKITSQGSIVSTPSGWPSLISDGAWEHQSGDGTAKININMQNDAMAINIMDVNDIVDDFVNDIVDDTAFSQDIDDTETEEEAQLTDFDKDTIYERVDGKVTIPFSIDSITEGYVCLGQIPNINDAKRYTYDAEAENGTGLFIAMNTEYSDDNHSWYNYISSGNSINFASDYTGLWGIGRESRYTGNYYLYIGTTNSSLTNITGTITVDY